MNVRVPAPSLCLVALLAASSAGAQAAGPAPLGERALLADFVEVTSRQVMRRDASLIELINMSKVTLDVRVGEGATTLQPGERMFAGVQPGEVPVKVIALGISTAPLEGDLQVEGGRHYELAFAYDVIPQREPAPSQRAQAAAPADETQHVKAAPARTRKDKVSVGRKRR